MAKYEQRKMGQGQRVSAQVKQIDISIVGIDLIVDRVLELSKQQPKHRALLNDMQKVERMVQPVFDSAGANML